MLELVMESRFGRLRELMAEHGLGGILFLDNTREELGAWLEGGRGRGKAIPWYLYGGYILKESGSIQYIGSNRCSEEKREIKNDPDMPAPPVNPFCSSLPVFYWGDFADAVREDRFGIVNPDALKKSVSDYLRAHFPNLQWVDLTQEVYKLKSIKCSEELEYVSRAALVHDKLFSAMEIVLLDGRLEWDIAVDIRQRMSAMGANGQDINSAVAVALSSAPDGGRAVADLTYPGRRVGLGDRINVAVSGLLWSEANGYSGALGRCYILGQASDEAKRCWSLAVEAQQFAVRQLETGSVASLGELTAKLNNEFMKPHGLEPENSAWAYGIGSARWEAPIAGKDTANWPLAQGMTVVLAPAVKLPGKDPYRCADMFALCEDGCRRLTKTSQELKELY